MPGHPNRERADRILDAAGELMLRMGYRKVSVDDIARAVGIGKGTVYLHWRTKERLFQALLLRESVDLVEEMIGHLRDDPATVLPYRMVRFSYVATMRRPLIMAMMSGQSELLGALQEAATAGPQRMVTEHIFDVLTKRGLVRDDLPHLAYAMRSASVGFYLIDELTPEYTGIALEERAEALSEVIRMAFAPREEPSPEVVAETAAELGSVLEELNSSYRKGIYDDGPG